MNKKKENIAVLVTIIMFMVLLIRGTNVQASSATITISSDKVQVEVGEEINVKITIKADEDIGGFEGNISYNSSVMEYQSGSSVISGGEGGGSLRIDAKGVDEISSTVVYNMKFKAKSVGSISLELQDEFAVYNYDDQLPMPATSNSVDIKVIAKEEASDNAFLKTLRTSPQGIKPEFQKEVYDYDIEVANNIETFIASAIAEDDKASVSVSGNNDLVEGLNEVIIEVKAESGKVQKYRINVMKQKEETEPEEVDEVVAGIKIIKEDGLLYAVFNGKIQIIDLDDISLIPQGYLVDKLDISGVTLITYKLEGETTSESVLVYGQDEFGNKGFYRIDLMENTVQRYFEETNIPQDEPDEENPTTEFENEELEAKYKSKTKKLYIVIGVLAVLTTILAIALIRMYMTTEYYEE